MIEDPELRDFYDWLRLQAKGSDPRVVLALRWMAEFEIYAEQDEDQLMELKAQLQARDDPEAASVLRLVAEFEETEEPDPMLKRLRDWLLAKGNDPTAVLVRWWLAEFEKVGEVDNLTEMPAPTIH